MIIYFLVLWISKIPITASLIIFLYLFATDCQIPKYMTIQIQYMTVWIPLTNNMNGCQRSLQFFSPFCTASIKKKRRGTSELGKAILFDILLYLGTWKNAFPSIMLVWKSSWKSCSFMLKHSQKRTSPHILLHLKIEKKSLHIINILKDISV